MSRSRRADPHPAGSRTSIRYGALLRPDVSEAVEFVLRIAVRGRSSQSCDLHRKRANLRRRGVSNHFGVRNPIFPVWRRRYRYCELRLGQSIAYQGFLNNLAKDQNYLSTFEIMSAETNISSLFAKGFHYSAKGNQLLAEELANYLIEKKMMIPD